MNQIDELIAEYCPEGVKYRLIGEVGTVVRGKRFVKADMTNSGVPCVHYGEIYTKYGNSATESFSFVTEMKAQSLRFANPNDVIMASAGETVEDIGKSFAWLGLEPIAIHDACYSFSSSLNPRFVAYFFNSRNFRDQIRNKISSSKISSVSTQNISKALIPVPPLDVQRAIVEILDKFTALETALEAELEARKKQYEHYRSQILSADKSARWITLEEVCHSISAGGDRPNNTVKGQKFPTKEHPYPVYSNGSEEKALYGFTDSYKISDKSVTISARGTIGYHAVRSPKFTPIVRLLVLIPNTELISAEFLNYILDITPISHSGGSIPQLTVPALKLIKIPLPELQSQHKIVDALEKFDALVNDLSSGLPAEIAARRKQYEYYRDQLLTFKELAS